MKYYIYKICGVRKEHTKENPKRACWYFISPFEFAFLLAFFDDKMWNVLGTEINRSIQEMKNPLNYQVIDKAPDWIVDIINSPEGKDVLEKNRGVLPVFVEEPNEIYH
jgi:hypothetical protein